MLLQLQVPRIKLIRATNCQNKFTLLGITHNKKFFIFNNFCLNPSLIWHNTRKFLFDGAHIKRWNSPKPAACWCVGTFVTFGLLIVRLTVTRHCKTGSHGTGGRVITSNSMRLKWQERPGQKPTCCLPCLCAHRVYGCWWWIANIICIIKSTSILVIWK